jgi:hypothetical protein
MDSQRESWNHTKTTKANAKNATYKMAKPTPESHVSFTVSGLYNCWITSELSRVRANRIRLGPAYNFPIFAARQLVSAAARRLQRLVRRWLNGTVHHASHGNGKSVMPHIAGSLEDMYRLLNGHGRPMRVIPNFDLACCCSIRNPQPFR